MRELSSLHLKKMQKFISHQVDSIIQDEIQDISTSPTADRMDHAPIISLDSLFSTPSDDG